MQNQAGVERGAGRVETFGKIKTKRRRARRGGKGGARRRGEEAGRGRGGWGGFKIDDAKKSAPRGKSRQRHEQNRQYHAGRPADFDAIL